MTKITSKNAKKENNTGLYAGLALLFLGGAYYLTKGSGQKKTNSTDEVPIGETETAPNPPLIYVNKILKKGSKGLEVQKLQSLMKITADGFFGEQTENMLLNLKGVTEITLDQFNKIPTINRSVLPKGTKVMAKPKNGTNIYNAIAKADGSYYSDEKIVETIPYGKAVGTIRSTGIAGQWYTVYYDAGLFVGTRIGFVKATDVEKY